MDTSLVSPGLLEYAVEELRRNAAGPTTPCKICQAPSTLLGALDFLKTCNPQPGTLGPKSVPVYYWRCSGCDFIFSRFFDRFDAGQWAEHVYNDDYYSSIDTEYFSVRPTSNAMQVDSFLGGRRAEYMCLDYGGGNGKTAELLRKFGYDYDTYDPYGLTSTMPERLGRYNFCSAFEVAEHTSDPVGFLGDIVRLSSTERLAILVSTYAHDGNIDRSGGISWWYAAPRNGHISLYSRQSLHALAGKFKLNCTSFSARTHLITRNYSRKESMWLLARGNALCRLKRVISP